MQAIEFDSVVQDEAIPLPEPAILVSGTQVRVVVMFEEKRVMEAQRTRDELISREPAHSVMISSERLAALEPHPDAVSVALDDLINSSWDEAAWREKWGGA